MKSRAKSGALAPQQFLIGLANKKYSLFSFMN